MWVMVGVFFVVIFIVVLLQVGLLDWWCWRCLVGRLWLWLWLWLVGLGLYDVQVDNVSGDVDHCLESKRKVRGGLRCKSYLGKGRWSPLAEVWHILVCASGRLCCSGSRLLLGLLLLL